MANTYTWNCDRVEVIKSKDGKTNIVKKLEWKATVSNGKETREISAWYNLDTENISNFIEFDDLDSNQMIQWFHSGIGESEVQKIKEDLDQYIYAVTTPDPDHEMKSMS